MIDLPAAIRSLDAAIVRAIEALAADAEAFAAGLREALDHAAEGDSQ